MEINSYPCLWILIGNWPSLYVQNGYSVWLDNDQVLFPLYIMDMYIYVWSKITQKNETDIWHPIKRWRRSD